MQPEVAAGVNLPPIGENEGRDADWEHEKSSIHYHHDRSPNSIWHYTINKVAGFNVVSQTDHSYKFNIECCHFYSVLNSTGRLCSISDLLYNLLSKITRACFLKECTVLKTAMPSIERN